MICGVLSLDGAASPGASAVDALRAASPETPVAEGPLAVVATGPEVAVARAEGLTCVLDGGLHEPGRLAESLGVAPGPDAELIARAYRRHGVGVLARLRGRFSLVLWDGDSRQALLACDVLATRQLFTHRAHGVLWFAGELRELLAAVPTRPGPDPVAFPTWLAGGSFPEGRTLYAGVARLGPGQCVTVSRDGVAPRTYWRPAFTGVSGADPGAVADGLRRALLAGARRRVSAGTDGVILSGGLDSSIVTAAAHAAKPDSGGLVAYSGVFPGQPYDESDKIGALTSALGIASRTLHIAPQGMVRQALAYLRRWQVPLAGMGAIVDIVAVDRAGRDGVEIVLDGQTGDEVLGFAPYLVSDRLRQGRLLAALRLIERWPGRPPATRHQRLWLLREIGIKGALPHRLGQLIRDRRAAAGEGSPWLAPALRARQAELEDRWAWKRRGGGPLWWRYLSDLQVYGPHREPRLDYLRHRAADAGVRGASPFYDPDVIAYCLTIPPQLQFDPGYDRPVARAAVRGLLPEMVRTQRVKADFRAFGHAALTGPDRAGIERLLLAADLEIAAYTDVAWVRRAVAELRAPTAGEPPTAAVWHLAAAEAWLRLQSDPQALDGLLSDPALPAVTATPAAAPR